MNLEKQDRENKESPIFPKLQSWLTPTLSGFEIFNDATLIIQNWLLSRIFVNILHHPNFIEDYKGPFSFFAKIRNYDFVLSESVEVNKICQEQKTYFYSKIFIFGWYFYLEWFRRIRSNNDGSIKEPTCPENSTQNIN